MTTRIYTIRRLDGTGSPRMVEASSPSTALRHVAADIFAVDTPRAEFEHALNAWCDTGRPQPVDREAAIAAMSQLMCLPFETVTEIINEESKES